MPEEISRNELGIGLGTQAAVPAHLSVTQEQAIPNTKEEISFNLHVQKARFSLGGNGALPDTNNEQTAPSQVQQPSQIKTTAGQSGVTCTVAHHKATTARKESLTPYE